MINNVYLKNLKSISFDDWAKDTVSVKNRRLFICASGYEERSTYFLNALPSHLIVPEDFIVIGFKEYLTTHSRQMNDELYTFKKMKIESFSPQEEEVLIKFISERIMEVLENIGEQSLEIHVDYSCMPRSWYCHLPSVLESLVREKDVIHFWYTPGSYSAEKYPTAGVDDFHLFSGKPTISPLNRTHFFGLGFDMVRSQAIWSVMDPSNLVCFYANPGVKEDYVERVEKENKEILLISSYKFTVPFDDFLNSLSKLVSVVRQFRSMGDVIIVPDGPKPLILASSLVPIILNNSGIVCFHVKRKKRDGYEPSNVQGINKPTGFSFSGSKVT